MHLKIHKVLLTDSSAVYDVVLGGTGAGQIYQIPCYTQDDAEAFLRGFAKLIEDHTLEAVTIETESRKPADRGEAGSGPEHDLRREMRGQWLVWDDVSDHEVTLMTWR
jgi:hypothetical protein